MTQLHSRRGEPGERDSATRPPWRGRVALVLATSTGGVGAHVADLARRLAAEGATVTVCGPSATDALFGFSRLDGAVGFSPVEISARTGLADTRAVVALRRALSAADPHLVHAHGLRAGMVSALVSALAGRSRRHRRPLVVTVHNAVLVRGVRGGAARLAQRTVSRFADVVLAASEDLRTAARDAGAADARLAPVAAPPLPPSQRGRAAVRAELGVPADRPLILSVGRLHPQKGYHTLVDAAARWWRRTPPPAVVIAGDGPAYLELASRISSSHAPVTLLGHRWDVADLLAAADLAVVSSVWEARQLFAQEALRAGVPLVATEAGGVPELVGEAALLVPVGDVDALDAAVTTLLEDAAARDRYARAGTRRAATWPTPERTLAQVVAVYRELLTTAPGRERSGGGS